MEECESVVHDPNPSTIDLEELILQTICRLVVRTPDYRSRVLKLIELAESAGTVSPMTSPSPSAFLN